MKKYLLFIFCMFFIVLFIIACSNEVYEPQIGENSIRDELYIQNLIEDMSQMSTSGILSTGIPYEFRGIFNIEEFRKDGNFYWERPVDSITIAKTSTEAAEAGQFYHSPWWIDNHRDDIEFVIEEQWILVVNYCLETDNWVMYWDFPIVGAINPMRRTYVYAINRTTGRVVGYSNRPVQNSQRTMNIPE